VAEVTTLFRLYDIDPLENNMCVCTSISQLVTDYAADTTGGLTATEILNMATGRMELGKKLIYAMMGAPDPSALQDTMGSITSPAPAVKEAKAAVEVSFESSSSKLYPSEEKTIKTYFSGLWGIDSAAVIVSTVAPTRRARELAMGARKLATALEVKVKGLVASPAAAEAASTAATSALSDTTTASAALGMPVTSVPVAATRQLAAQGDLPYASAGIFAILLLLFVNCFAASMCATKARKKAGAESVSCCKTGCCGYYALPTWAKASALSAVLIIVASLLAYMPIGALATAFGCLIDQLLLLSNVNIQQIAQIAAALPTEILNLVNAYIGFLPIVAILPGLVAAVFLLLQFICGNTKCKTHCCFKFNAILAQVFLVICFVIGIVFVAIAIALYIPQIQEQLAILTSTCETIVPTLTKLKNDISGIPAAALPAEAAGLVTALPQATTIIETACPCIYTMLDKFTAMLFPGLMLSCSAIYAMWCNCGALCSSCCTSSVAKVGIEK